MPIITSVRMYCEQSCLLVGWFVCSLIWRQKWFLEKWKSDVYKIWQGCSASAPNIIINLQEVKVKVQGQNRRAESIPLATALLWFRISSASLVAIRYKWFRHKIIMPFDNIQDGGLRFTEQKHRRRLHGGDRQKVVEAMPPSRPHRNVLRRHCIHSQNVQ